MNPVETQVLLVDDHEIVRHGLAAYVASTSDLRVWRSAASAAEALELLRADPETLPDVAVLDVRLPDMDGISLCREIRAEFPSVGCLMLSSFTNQDSVFGALLAGAAGYVPKDAPLEDVMTAIREVAAGRSLLDPALTAQVLDRIRQQDRKMGTEALTDSERRVLDLISTGMTNREISAELHLAEQTVKNYVSSLLSKLGMKRRTQAAIYAVDLQREVEETE